MPTTCPGRKKVACVQSKRDNDGSQDADCGKRNGKNGKNGNRESEEGKDDISICLCITLLTIF